MFELKISGIFEASRWADNSWPTHIVSMVDPGVAIPFTCKNHLVVHLHDVEQQLKDYWILPNESHVESILEFTKDLTASDRLLVHCHQGLSRSTSAAIGIMIQHGMDYHSAYKHVESVRDILLPNGLITNMIDSKFDLNGELLALVMSERVAKIKSKMGQQANSLDHRDVTEMKYILSKLDNI